VSPQSSIIDSSKAGYINQDYRISRIFCENRQELCRDEHRTEWCQRGRFDWESRDPSCVRRVSKDSSDHWWAPVSPCLSPPQLPLERSVRAQDPATRNRSNF